MRRSLIVLFCLLAAPLWAQDVKDEGLAGGGKKNDDDAFAPKVKRSLQDQINEAIKKGVAWLKKRQDDKGSWGPVLANRVYGQTKTHEWRPRDPTGPTSFAMYALAKCGVKKSDPVMKKGYRWLRGGGKTGRPVWGPGKAWDQTGDERHPKSTTYESAALIMMLEAMHTRSAKNTRQHRKRKLVSDNPMKPPPGSKIPKEDWRWMHERIVWLTKGLRGKRNLRPCQNTNGGWRYGQANGTQDLSSTQFVLLALRAASQAGYPVEKTAPDTWRWAANFVRQCQTSDGGFGYMKGRQWGASMDACGIASLVICKEQMELVGQPVPSWIQPAITKGLAHLDKVFEPNQNKGTHEGGPYLYYYLYGVERVGDLTARKEFGGKDWYVRGARFLIAHQQDDGKWEDSTAFPPRDVLGTCYALLFLKRATPPTVTISEN